MGRRAGRQGNKPPAIEGPVRHHPQCCCDRCIEDDTTKVEKRLEHQRAKYEAAQAIANAKASGGGMQVYVRESPVIGPFEGTDESKALYLNVPVAICTTIIPKGKKRK